MARNNLFFDSSALIAGILSHAGAARVLLILAEDEKIILTVSEQVIIEVERNIARKAPKVLTFAREMILRAKIQIAPIPTQDEVEQCRDWIDHIADIPILVAARNAPVDFLVTLNTRHFLEDPEVARRSGLRIGTPGDALAWVREQLSRSSTYHTRS